MVSLRSNLRFRRPQQRVRNARVVQTREQMREFIRCSPLYGADGFIRWCARHAKIQDPVSGAEVPFVLFEGQRRIAPLFVDGHWVIGLKGRQLGLTSLAVFYVLWRATYSKRFVVVCVSQLRQYANDMIRRIKWTWERLDPAMRCRITKETMEEMRFEADGMEVEMRSLVGSDKTARSLTGNLIIFDEASRVRDFDEALAASIPALEVAKGQCIVLSTSAGPQGMFYDLWQRTYGEDGELVDADGVGPTGFTPVFLHWSGRPGRDQAWYDSEEARLKHISPVAMKQEHPNNPREAWEHAAGRVYPLFTSERCVGDIEITAKTERYRAIDWGGAASAHVVLWMAHVPGPPGLLISPKCPNTVREMLGYRWDEDHPDRPIKKDDHAVDALRYAVSTFGFTGLVYVYREVYRTDSLAKGFNPLSHLEEIHRLSGWIAAPPDVPERWIPGRDAEFYEDTVYDGHGLTGLQIASIYKDHDLPCRANKTARALANTDDRSDNIEREVISGIQLVSILVDGSFELEKRIPVVRAHAEALAMFKEDRRPMRHKVSFPLERVQRHALAKKLLGVT